MLLFLETFVATHTSVNPPGHDRIGGHYFHTWCPSEKHAKTLKFRQTKYALRLTPVLKIMRIYWLWPGGSSYSHFFLPGIYVVRHAQLTMDEALVVVYSYVDSSSGGNQNHRTRPAWWTDRHIKTSSQEIKAKEVPVEGNRCETYDELPGKNERCHQCWSLCTSVINWQYNIFVHTNCLLTKHKMFIYLI